MVTIEHGCEAEDGDRWVSLRAIAAGPGDLETGNHGCCL